VPNLGFWSENIPSGNPAFNWEVTLFFHKQRDSLHVLVQKLSSPNKLFVVWCAQWSSTLL
jgi:hypothetical protein